MSEIARMMRASDWLQRLSAGTPDEKQIEEWLEWCRESPENLVAFEKVQEVWQGLCLAEPPRAIAPAPRRSRMSAGFIAGLAASVLGAAIVGGWQFASWREGHVRTLTTAVAEQASQALADGSRVDLGAQTRIVTHYTGWVRSITLEEGEAFFSVVKESRRPFVVDAGGMRLTAVGTAFNVRRAGDRTTVVVSEGAVLVAPGQNGHEFRVGAGDQVTLVASSNTVLISRVDPQIATAWRHGMLKFVEEPLGAVVSSINRYSRRHIEIADPDLANEVFTGTVYAERTDEWLEALQYVLPVNVVEDPAGSIRVERR